MPRKEFRLLTLAALLPLFACEPGSEDPVVTAPPVNVLLVVLDTTRSDVIGAYGAVDAHTPVLDGLAREGVLFTHARSTSAWTVPSHGSLFTGLYPSNHGAHHENYQLGPEQMTLAELLSGTHQTAGFSENSFIQLANGYGQGFEHFDDVWRLRENWRDPPDTVGHVEQWVQQRDRERPFFLFVNLMTAHLPYDPPPRHSEPFVPEGTPEETTSRLRQVGDREAFFYMTGDLELPPASLEILRGLYRGDVAYVDEQLGRILETLRAENVLDETLVIVVSDHGENIGEHGLMEHQFCLYETLLRVPMIFRLPSVLDGGRRIDAPVQLVDVVPTVLDVLATREDRWPQLDGRSLLGEAPPATRPVLAEYMRPVIQQAVYEKLGPELSARFDRRLKSFQVGALKLIVSDSGDVELYDLDRDPGETRNLAEERPEQTALLRAQLEMWSGREWQPRQRGGLPAIDKQTERELRSLGYIP